ncbi:sodium/proline symporter [Crocosphaera sp. Alani8]|uniref:sodium/proline symporter n=1 Tax=Crocosphaera sp. Alani8 TaxID=3038952 RepID=UPI00313F305B
MVDQIGIIIAFIFFLLLFTGVGTYSATQKKATTTDYLLASRSVNPWLTALSAMATGQSGLLFIGQVGFAYESGISTIWLVIGWVIGDYLAWWFVFQPLRQLSEETASDTVSAFLAQNIKGYRIISLISALITLVFLGTYAAAQLVAGSKALNSVFGWNYNLGIIIGAIIVAVYCFSGGIRASIWTDALQGILMLGSLLLLVIVAVIKCGGLSSLWESLNSIDPNLTNLSPQSLPLGFIPFFIGWMVAGFGVVGQPHIMVRAMAIDSVKNLAFARNLKTSLGLTNSFSALGIGLTARVLLPNLLTSGDPELALPYLSLELLPVVLVGLILAGLFSATMSTADSQIISCSAALTQDIFPGMSKSYNFAKIGTLSVTAIVLGIALAGDNNVFALVTFSWSVLASGLGPLLLVKVWQQPINTTTAIAMMVTGIATALVWRVVLSLSGVIYEVLPGMLAGMAVYGVYRLFFSKFN